MVFIAHVPGRNPGQDYYLLKSSQTRGLGSEGTLCCISLILGGLVLFSVCSPRVTAGSSVCTHEEVPVPVQSQKTRRWNVAQPSMILNRNKMKYK